MNTIFAIGVLGFGGEIGMVEEGFNKCSVIKIKTTFLSRFYFNHFNIKFIIKYSFWSKHYSILISYM